jgi:hypothetical protein
LLVLVAAAVQPQQQVEAELLKQQHILLVIKP